MLARYLLLMSITSTSRTHIRRPFTTKLRRVKYLNKIVENDHKSAKQKSRYRQWYQYFATASATISGMKTMRIIQKGQVEYLAKNDIISQKN